MPDIDTENPPEQQVEEKKEAPASKSMVGIIYPPPEVRNIVDKTADFVARNGREFEERIKHNEAGNAKFNFLNPHDPYHAYYQHKIKEIQEGVAQELASTHQTQPLAASKPPTAIVTEPEVPSEPPSEWEYLVTTPSISGVELDIVKLTAQFVARNGAQFLDKLMMREQRNYQFDFLRKQHPLFVYFTKLVEQFSKILLPSHETMDLLRTDVENPLGVLERVNRRVEWELYQQRQRRKLEEQLERERVEYAQIDWHDFVLVETISFRENETGYLPPPIKPTQLAQRLLQQSKYERLQEESGEVQEIEMEVDEQEPGEEQMSDQAKRAEGSQPPAPPQQSQPPPPPLPPTRERDVLDLPTAQTGPGGVQIRKDYNPKQAQVAPHQQMQTNPNYLISPITGEKIPVDKLQDHMKYGLLDPRWIEEKKKTIEERRMQEEVLAEGTNIGTSLKHLAERRTDIFGTEETVIGMKIGEDRIQEKKKKPLVQWDGHSSSVDIVQRAAQARSVMDEKIEAIQKAQADAEKERIGPSLPRPQLAPPVEAPSYRSPQPPLPTSTPPRSIFPSPPMPSSAPLLPSQPPLPPSSAARPPLPPPPPTGLLPLAAPSQMQPPPPPFGMGQFMVDIAPPVAKKQRTETDDLIPEQEFIAKNPGAVTFRVLVPNMPEHQEWKLKGQMLSVTLPITDPVSVIKVKVADELGMPTGKQKLQIGVIFLKDSNSLGFYNVTPATVVQLGLKERGGRKK
ncbi:hypothetical protein EMCRGX_G023512 [Ephydatia muelleri]